MTKTNPPKFSTGGLIAAWIMTVLSLITLINVYNREHRLDWSMVLGYAGGAGFLFWRAYRPPMSFGRGVLTWFGGLFVGVGVGFVLFFMFQATGPSFGMRLLNAVGILVICLGAGWGLLKLGSGQPKPGPPPGPTPPAS